MITGEEAKAMNPNSILNIRYTRFPRVQGMNDEKSPETILAHDRVICLGDLNHRIALSYRSAKALVEMQNWRALLVKDQVTPPYGNFLH